MTASPERDMQFAKIATKEIEDAFDQVWSDGSWRPYKDEDDVMHGIQWGWALQNGHLFMTVSGAGKDDERFKEALAAAINRAVRKATYLEAQRRRNDPEAGQTSRKKRGQAR